MAQKAVIPFSGDIPQQPLKVTEDQYAKYPEAGVKWARFYKVLTGEGKWELHKQTPYSRELGYSTASGLITSKPTYLTSISIHRTNLVGGSANGDAIDLYDAKVTSVNYRWSHNLVNGSDTAATVWTFPAPLIFFNGIYYDNGTIFSGGRLSLRLFGWQE